MSLPNLSTIGGLAVKAVLSNELLVLLVQWNPLFPKLKGDREFVWGKQTLGNVGYKTRQYDAIM